MSALTDTFTSIANAIRAKLGVQTTYTPAQMPTAIASIPTPKEEQTKSVTATTSQQTVTPDSGKVLSSVTVNPQNHVTSYSPRPNTALNDMGQNHNYRYVSTSAMYSWNDSYNWCPRNNYNRSTLISGQGKFNAYMKAFWARIVFTATLGPVGSTTWSKSVLTDADSTSSADYLTTRVDPDFGYINNNGSLVVNWDDYGSSETLTFDVTLCAWRGRTSDNKATYSGISIRVNGTSVYYILGSSSDANPTLKNQPLSLKYGDVIEIYSRVGSGSAGNYSRIFVAITTKRLES